MKVATVVSALLAGLGWLTVAGCAPALIPNTEVRDTSVNREIFNVVESYRKAMENRDVDTLRTLVSRRYYENASSTGDTADDWGFPDLDRVLGELKDAVKTTIYEIKVKEIQVDGERASCDFEYTWSFQYTDGEQDGWSRKTDENRLSFLKEDGRWKIVAGM